jgi:apolipoprotein N-acyltransferase
MAISWLKNKRLAYAFFILTFITLLPNTLYKNQTTEYINVSIIQPASDPFLKYTNGYKNIIETNLLKLYRNRSKESDIVIFPEAELPYALESKEFNEFSRKLDLSQEILTGAWHFADGNLFNSLVNLNTNEIYNKQHLVPFGEYIPFISSLRGLISFFDMPMSNVTHGRTKQNAMKLDSFDDIKFAPLICYDIAFGNTVRKSNISSNFMINISNDTWFGDSIGPYHHLDIARVRAIENNKWIVRSTNDGFSAIIDNNGTIVTKIEKGDSSILNGSISLLKERSFYNIYGYLIPYLFALIVILFSVIINLCSKRRA